MFGIEINFIVQDSLKALEFYEMIFELERVEVSNYEKGHNEVIFTMYGSRFHLLDENLEYQLNISKEVPSIWLNIYVDDIRKIFEKALLMGCRIIQPITYTEALGISNAVFGDINGYIWMLHQIHQEVSYEDRSKYLESMLIKNKKGE